MSHDEPGDRLIVYWRDSIIETPGFLESRRAAGSVNGLLMNYEMWSESHIGIGIIHWRRGQDPRPEFAAGLGAIEQGITEAVALNASPQDVDQLKLWMVHPIAYLMNRTLPALEGSDEQLEAFPLIAASFLLADALYDRPYRDRLPAIIKALSAKKRQMLALLSFQLYFDLLESAGDERRIAKLAAQGDAFYLRRAKDEYYDETFLGGGLNNAVMLDWQLAAVLKKVGFEGDSPNRWRWD